MSMDDENKPWKRLNASDRKVAQDPNALIKEKQKIQEGGKKQFVELESKFKLEKLKQEQKKKEEADKNAKVVSIDVKDTRQLQKMQQQQQKLKEEAQKQKGQTEQGQASP